MSIIEIFKKKVNHLKNSQKILYILNAYLITQIFSTYLIKSSIQKRKFLYNGVSKPNFSQKSFQVDMIRYILLFCLSWLVLYFALKIIQKHVKNIKLQYILLLVNVSLFAIVNAAKNQANLPFTVTISVIVVAVYYYVIIKKKVFTLENFDINIKTGYIIIGIMFSLYLLIVGGLTVIRYINFHQSTYDTGIFSQMYYYMSKTFEPNTTIERRRLISHFAVHFAPDFYLLLPGYMIFKSTIYLAIMKTILVASAALPLYKLGKQKGLSNLFSTIIAVIYLLSPILISSNIGDGNGHILNENYFYSAFLIWLFYYIEKENFKAVWIFSILTLMVKEDGAIIIASIALFLFFSKKSTKHAIGLFITSAVYFIACSYFIMPQFGTEVMYSSMYSNFVPSNDSAFISILYSFIFKPSYVLGQVFTQGKVAFLLEILVPILFIPIISLRKFHNLFLLIPIIFTSLLCKNPMYIYGFSSHHNMAALCILFYLTILGLCEIKSKRLQFFLIISSLCVTCIFTTSYNIHKFDEAKYYHDNKDTIKVIDDALDRIPKNASVSTSYSFSTKLTNRDKLYPFYYSNCDFLVLDLRYVEPKMGKSIKELLLGYNYGVYNYKDNKYGVYDYKKDTYLILQKNHSTERNASVYIDQFGK